MEEHVPFVGYAIALNNSKKPKCGNGRLCSFFIYRETTTQKINVYFLQIMI